MKILLINPPIREDIPAYQEPIGLMSVATALRRAGHEVVFMDINCHRFPWEELQKRLPADPFDIIGLSGLITTYKFNSFAVPVLRRAYPEAAIVIGGAGLTSAPETYMQNLRPDFGVIGEGEDTMVELANTLQDGGQTRGMSGLTYFEGDDIRYGPPRPLVEDIDTFYPLDWDAIDVNAYANVVRHVGMGRRELSMLATRGCPMACNFCYHIFGRKFRWRSPAAVVEEMAMLSDRYNVDAFMMADECLTANPKYLTEFCERLIAAKLGIHWSAFSRVDTIDANLMCLMADAGCVEVGFGMETGSQRILDAMNKRVTVEQMENSFRTAGRIFPKVGTTWIFGYPGEDDASILENIAMQGRLDIYRGYFHLQPYPGTKVYEENLDKILAKYGSLDAFFRALGDAGDYTVNLTDWSEQVYNEKYKELHKRLALSHVKRHAPPQLYNALCS